MIFDIKKSTQSSAQNYLIDILIQPQKITLNNDILFIDYGKTWFGNVAIMPPPEMLGKKIKLKLAEKDLGASSVDSNPPGSVRYFEKEVLLSGPFIPDLDPQDKRGSLRPQGILPMRYLQIEGWTQTPQPQQILFFATISGRYQNIGSFLFKDWEQTDQTLNRLHDLGQHTIKATSFMDLFIDGDRERLPYEADAYINQLGWHFLTGDTSLSRKTLKHLLKSPTWPSEWMSHFIFLTWEDFFYTGDQDFLATIYPHLKVFLLLEFIDSNGLINTTQNTLAQKFKKETQAEYLEDIVDWPQSERDHHVMTAHNTVVNAFVYASLIKMSFLAENLKKHEDAQKFKDLALKLKKSMHDLLINKKTRLFVDGISETHSSAHSLFFPLLFDLVPPENVAATLAALRTKIINYQGGFPCSVYGAQYLLEALFKHQEDQLALDLILNNTNRGWLNMLDRHQVTLTHEAWDPRFKENLDWNHPWGTAFYNILPKYLIGAHPIEPGWKKWTLHPSPKLQGTVQLKIPTPNGTIEILIYTHQRKIQISHPQNTKFESNLKLKNWSVSIIQSQNSKAPQ